tara:strand:+ start:206 stop:706 length:501 start_codon:yes stop_codon:yes gene_type:complete
VIFVALNKDLFSPEHITAFVKQFGIFAVPSFVLIYIIAALAFLPSFIFTMLGGLLFGTFWGGIFSLLGATLGAMLSFLVSRYIASDYLEKLPSVLIQKLRNGTQDKGWRYVAFTRLTMVFPYNLQNYGYGLTKISCFEFTLTTFLAMAPSTFAYAYLGHIGKAIVF